jgi:amino acid adenylation domain-containing protein
VPVSPGRRGGFAARAAPAMERRKSADNPAGDADVRRSVRQKEAPYMDLTTHEVRLAAGWTARLAGDRAGLVAAVTAAHLKVLAAVTGERGVATRRIGPDGEDRVVAVRVPDGGWGDLIAALRQAGRDGAATDVLDLSGLWPAGGGGPGSAAPVIGRPPATSVRLRDGQLRVTCRHRDRDAARRLAGYHIAALRHLSEDPGAAHDTCVLLSGAERAFQLTQLNGRRTPLPGRWFPGLFAEQARRTPDATAAVHGGARLSYARLDERSDAIAGALLDHGTGAEDVVAVVTGRTLDWLAAVIGVLKAGGAYLPIRPDFPAQRIASYLDRSRCRVVVAERHGDFGGRPVLALPDIPSVPPGTAAEPAGGQLAYIYFTSGSTGEPKGAMCEHAGLLNHLLAKIEDMGIGPGDVVAQTASQCFDISLWQLIAPLLVGASTKIIDTPTQLDISSFVEELADVNVAQLVPSYLDVLVTHLERSPHPLPRLRAVSVTGEYLKHELVARWFAVHPGVRLVNAYGATEVSDDTMHEILDGPPAGPVVPVGRPLRNVDAYVLDERQRLVPFGSPGEIVFSGVSVGRGYINDPERTACAFVEDPYRPGQRMYRTGDYGRWMPDGRIEFLGRLDEQVKIRGFRVEMGEIENRLLRIAGVRNAAVVVDGSGSLAAFVSGEAGVEAIRAELAAQLPDYMIPSYFHRLAELPLTENGKTDKKHLRRLAGALGHAGAAYAAPSTPAELLLATAFSEVLNVPLERIGRDDDFFGLGGTSLAAVRMIVKLEGKISLKDLNRSPVLGELAGHLESGAAEEATILQRLGGPPGTPAATLVCFPYAAGNAVNFQALARELERYDIAAYAAELPGHDVGTRRAPLAPLPGVAERVHRELSAAVPGPVMIWGHCAGAALALGVARRMEDAGRAPEQVFVGGLLLDDVTELAEEIDTVTAIGNREIAARLRADSAYVEFDDMKDERADLVGAAYRHDVRAANQHLIGARRDPGAHRITTPVTVVVADDDPSTAGYDARHADWGLLAGAVSLRVLPDGGHYFVRTRAAEAARIVAEARALANAG